LYLTIVVAHDRIRPSADSPAARRHVSRRGVKSDLRNGWTISPRYEAVAGQFADNAG
jgi:hypothetical protein